MPAPGLRWCHRVAHGPLCSRCLEGTSKLDPWGALPEPGATPGGLPKSRGVGAFFGPQLDLLGSVWCQHALSKAPVRNLPVGHGPQGWSHTVLMPWHVRVWHLS